MTLEQIVLTLFAVFSVASWIIIAYIIHKTSQIEKPRW